MEFHHDNAEALCQACATRLADAMIDDLRQGRKPTMALAGGRTAPPIFRQLCTQDLPWAQLTVVPTDERWVPYAHPDCNLRQLRESFLAPGLHSVSLVPENPQGEVDAGFARRQLTQFAGEFSAVMLGMGADGHTASIFPHQMKLLTADAICGLATHPESGQQRITLTGKVLNNATEVAFLVTGQGKAQKVEEIIKGKEGSSRYPAAHIEPTHGRLHWFVDEAAAAGLR